LEVGVVGKKFMETDLTLHYPHLVVEIVRQVSEAEWDSYSSMLFGVVDIV
jgi:hypothetical protein